MKRVRQKNMRVMNQLDCQCRLLDNERKVGLCLHRLIEYEIIGEGSQVLTNQKSGNSAFSLLIG